MFKPIGRAVSLPSPPTPSTKVLFHCLKKTCVCFKAHSVFRKGLSFPIWRADMFDLFRGFSSSLVHRKVVRPSVQQRLEEERDMTLCQTLTLLVDQSWRTFCRSFSGRRMGDLLLSFFYQVKPYILLGMMGKRLSPVDVQTCLSVLAERVLGHVCVCAFVYVCMYVSECVCGPCEYT